MMWSLKTLSTVGILIVVLLLAQQGLGARPKSRLASSNKLRRTSNKNELSGDKNNYKIVCYYTNWSQYRPKDGKFMPEDIDPELCTHIVFAFGWLKRGKLSSFEANDETKDKKKGLYERISELKSKNSNLKTLLAIGGWSFGTEKFKEMSGSRYSRQIFILDSITYLRNRSFDGLDIDWEYPKGEDDKKNYVSLLKELNEAFEAEAKETKTPKLLLTAAVPAGAESIKGGFDVPEVSKYLDFINLMAYDFHGKWESVTGHNSPLYAPSSDSQWRQQLCTDFAADMWVRLGAPKEKIVIGMGTYGRSFTLADPDKNGVNVAAKGGGKAGVYTREEGFLAYYEICEILKSGATYVWDEEMKVPFTFYDDQWIGFDDERSILTKLKWVKENGYGGAMVWTVDMDDFKGLCGNGVYPLIGLMKQELKGIPRPQGPAIMDWSTGKLSRKVEINTAKVIATTTPRPAKIISPPKTTPKPVRQVDLVAPKIICYFTTWSTKRPGHGKFMPQNINQTLCTHVIIAFATIKDGKLAAPSDSDEELYAQTIDLKKEDPALKVLLALGGWNFGSKPFREMTESVFKRNSFVYDAVEFLRSHDFDGIEIDWEYPRGPEEKDQYTQLLKELKEAFDGEAKMNKVPKLILSAAVPANSDVIQAGYDVPEITKYLDIINIMTYDYHGLWENHVGHNSPLKPMSSASNYDKKLTTEFSAEEWAKLGAPREKLMIGLATYGRTFTLDNPKEFDIGSASVGGGKPGKFTKEPGILAFYEICDLLRENATLIWDMEQLVPFAYKGDQWVGFDDERSVKGKVDWLKSAEFGGVMVWSIDLDDFDGHCGGPAFPLLGMINKELQGYGVPGAGLNQESSILYGTAVQSAENADVVVCKEADGFISYHKDKQDCTMYYMCEGDRRHHMPCPTNLVFNPNENVCDWPENVDGCATQGKR